MNPSWSFAAATILVLAVLHYHDGAFAAVEEKSCNSVVQDLTKKQLGGIAACSKAMKFKNGKEKAKKMTCVMKCVLKKEAFLNEEGQLSYQTFDGFLDKHFPPSMHEKVNSTFRPCIESAVNGLDDKEEFCKDYDGLIKCLMGSFPNMCK